MAALLGIGHVVLAVNKMDLVDWSEQRFDGIVAEATVMAAALGIGQLVAIPLSALAGDNVVERSPNMAWYAGRASSSTSRRSPSRPTSWRPRPCGSPCST